MKNNRLPAPGQISLFAPRGQSNSESSSRFTFSFLTDAYQDHPLTPDQEHKIDHMVDDQGFIYSQARQIVLGN